MALMHESAGHSVLNKVKTGLSWQVFHYFPKTRNLQNGWLRGPLTGNKRGFVCVCLQVHLSLLVLQLVLRGLFVFLEGSTCLC